MECLVDDLRHFRWVHDPLGPLGDWGDGVQLVVDLVEHAAVAADLIALDLTANNQHRRGCGVGGGDARRCVQKSGTGNHQRSADLATGTGVAVGHIGGGLLMADGNEPDARLVVQAVHHVVELDSGQTEYHPDALPV